MPVNEGKSNHGEGITENSTLTKSSSDYNFEDRSYKKSLNAIIFWPSLAISLISFLIIGVFLFIGVRNQFFQPETPVINFILPGFMLLIIALASTGLIAWLSSRRIAAPIQELIQATQRFIDGDWQTRITAPHMDETGLLAAMINHMAKDLSVLYTNMDSQVKEKTRQLKVAAEVTQIIISATDINELFSKTCNLAIERFNCYSASIYLMDDVGNSLSLAHSSGPVPEHVSRKNFRLATNAQNLVGWAASMNQIKIISTTSTYPFANRDLLLPEIQSETAIPMVFNNKVCGVLHLQSDLRNAFDQEKTTVLQTLANQLASAYQNYQHIQVAEDTLQGANLLYEASHQIITASTEAEIYQVAAKALQHTPYQSALLSVDYERLHFLYLYNPLTREQPDTSQWENIKTSDIASYLQPGTAYIIQELSKSPTELTSLVLPLRTVGGQSAALIPIYSSNQLIGLMIISARDRTFLSGAKIQSFTSLGEIMGNAIDKLRKIQQVQTRLSGLKASAEIGVNIAMETDLQQLYKVVHAQIADLLGDVQFMIALYHPDTKMIEVPYMIENGVSIPIDPFPLGQGLTSILIKERKPLLLVNDVEKESAALGAKVIGAPAKSWLGVPLIVGKQVIGAMIVQDTEKEHRFSKNDVDLLNSLVPQLTVSIRMAQNIGELEKSTQQLQTVAEIAREASTDLQLDQLLPHLINLVKERFGFYHASIFLLDPTGEFAILRESTGEAGAQMKLAGHKLAKGSKSIVGQTATKGAPVVVNDVTQDNSFLPNPLLPNTRSEAGIPLKSGDRVLGVLDVQSTQAGAFTNADINIFTLLADQLAVAVINAELFAETQIHLKQLRDMHQITSAAASRTSVVEALISTVNGLSALLQNAHVSIFLLNPLDDALEIKASVGYEGIAEIDTLKIKVGEGVVGTAAKARKIINIPDVKNEPHYISIDPDVCSELAIPLLFHERLVGILNLESDHIHAFKEDDQEMLGALAGGLAGIITNTQLVEQNQRQVDNGKQLYQVTNKIREAFDINTILEISSTEIGKLLHARKVTVEINPNSPDRGENLETAAKKNGGV